jgi:pyridoxal/pyridoxine/pyridoxamine kinase
VRRFLTQMTVTDEKSAWACIDRLHETGTPCIIIKSISFNNENDTLHMLGSWRLSSEHERFRLTFRRLPHTFTGTGDLMSALLLAHGYRHQTGVAALHPSANLPAFTRATSPAARACESALAVMQAVLAHTIATVPPGTRTPEIALVSAGELLRTSLPLHVFAQRV